VPFRTVTVLLAGLILVNVVDSPQGLLGQSSREQHHNESDDPSSAELIELTGIENLFRLSAGLYSGGQPEGEAGFSDLKRLGIATIISVDGARPDVDRARSIGMRYVHLPFGYDGDDAQPLVESGVGGLGLIGRYPALA
jgi:hypothetical protein